jgi:hypothetical protein
VIGSKSWMGTSKEIGNRPTPRRLEGRGWAARRAHFARIAAPVRQHDSAMDRGGWPRGRADSELDEVGEHDAARVVGPRLDEAAADRLGVGLVRLELADD